jgi:hypothetical protein
MKSMSETGRRQAVRSALRRPPMVAPRQFRSNDSALEVFPNENDYESIG